MQERNMSDSATIQRTSTTILQHFVTTGRTPHYVELANSVEIDINAARKLRRETASTAAFN